ncbi:MAG: DUF4157 domain-containing protein [bacterium]|nr:DUF4157 domain-containing protein [bacterium]
MRTAASKSFSSSKETVVKNTLKAKQEQKPVHNTTPLDGPVIPTAAPMLRKQTKSQTAVPSYLSLIPGLKPVIQTKTICPCDGGCPQCRDTVQRKPANKASSNGTALSAINNIKGGGQPLPATTRAFFEPRFNYDFSQVRVHTDAAAADMARMVRANAFTTGRHIVFAAGRYAPATGAGKLLLAHELAHVVQQDAQGVTSPEMGATQKKPAENEKICGPDVTNEVKRVWKEIQDAFESWGIQDRIKACFNLVFPVDIMSDSYLNEGSFDTLGLCQRSAKWLREKPYHPACGFPGSCAPLNTNPDEECHESDKTCSNSVQIGNECWLSGTPNYGTYGIMMRLCRDWLEELPNIPFITEMILPIPLFPTIKVSSPFSRIMLALMVNSYKRIKGDDVLPPLKWALAAYDNGPSATVDGGNRSECECKCNVSYGEGTGYGAEEGFDFVWEPVKTRPDSGDDVLLPMD